MGSPKRSVTSCGLPSKKVFGNRDTMGFAGWMPYVGVDEAKKFPDILFKLVAEMIGTMFLVLVGCGSCFPGGSDDAAYVRIALCFGVTVATIAQSIGHISGCHINPAVTLGLFFGGKIGLINSILYIVAQLIGGLIGAGLLKAFLGELATGGVGVTALGTHKVTINDVVTKVPISVGQGFGIEFFITFVLVLVVFASAADDNNTPSVKGSAPLAIGLSITTCHLFAIPLTGSSMNPARSFGSNVVFGKMENLWLYFLGPILGGITAAIVYQLCFQAPEIPKTKTLAEAHELDQLKKVENTA